MEASCIERDSTTNFLPPQGENTNAHGGEIPAQEDIFYENNETTDADTSKPKRKKRRHRAPRSWKDKWQEAYTWASLRQINGEDRMFCTLCEAFGSTSTRNAFRLEGSCNFQPSALSTHENSSAHKNACLSRRAWAQPDDANSSGIERRNWTEMKSQGMVSSVFESTVIADQLACMADMLETAVTRDDFYTLRAELHIMQRAEDARRINAFCAPTDPLVPVPNLDGSIPDNLPGSLAEMMMISSDHIEALLMEYKLPIHGTQEAKLRRLKAHLGFCN